MGIQVGNKIKQSASYGASLQFSTLTQWQHNGPKLQHNFYIEFNPVQLRMASKMYTCNFSMNDSEDSDCIKTALLNLKINHLVHIKRKDRSIIKIPIIS